MTSPTLSIIIPTHRRAGILEQCLRHIDAQTIADQLEVIVVSDGEDPQTTALFSKWTGNVPVTFFSIPKSHQGTARNRGVDKAKGRYCLFIGDDIFLQPDACEVHLQVLEKQRTANSELANNMVAVLGHTTWDPSLSITPVMRWLEQSGWQFGYPMIEAYAHRLIPQPMQHSFTYTSHISLPMPLAREVNFREDLTLYGWEDMEWGLRLGDAGARLLYEPDAKALHHHPMTLAQSLTRMETLGRAAVVMQEMVDGFDGLPSGLKLLAYRIAALLPTMAGKHRAAFLRGIDTAKV